MASVKLPPIIEPAELAEHLGAPGLLIVDLSKPELYAQQHIPGALHLDAAQLVSAQPPVMGLLPDEAQLSKLFSSLGLTPQHHVVAYDDEGGLRAGRLLWTLDVIGHSHHSLLNGGLRAWLAGGHPLSTTPSGGVASDYRAQQHDAAKADKDYIKAHLGDPDVVLLDARTLAEYRGVDKRAQRSGHIPGAVNLDWTLALDSQDNMRLKPEAELRAAFKELGVTADKEIITYCQTHQRSAHSYVVLKALGYPRVKGYPGAWSEWGNSSDTPIE